MSLVKTMGFLEKVREECVKGGLKMNKYFVSILLGMAILLATSGAMWLGHAPSHSILMVNAIVAIVLLLLAIAFAHAMTKNPKVEPIGILSRWAVQSGRCLALPQSVSKQSLSRGIVSELIISVIVFTLLLRN